MKFKKIQVVFIIYDFFANKDNTMDYTYIKQILQETSKVEGWMTELSAILFNCLLSKQKDFNKCNNMIEFGVFKGKSASILQNYIDNNSDSKLYLVDIQNILEIQLKQKTIFTINSILDLSKEFYDRRYSFIHEDTLHIHSTTIAGLEFANKRLTKTGIYVIDDFAFDHMAVVTTTLQWLANNPQFRIFLIDNRKCYIARTEAIPLWYNYIVNEFPDDYEAITGKKIHLHQIYELMENTAIFVNDDDQGGITGYRWGDTIKQFDEESVYFVLNNYS